MIKDLSVIILTKNEEKNILDCLERLLPAEEIIIVDDHSTDRTLEVIRSMKRRNIKIFEHDLNFNFCEQRNFGLEKASKKWILFIDADERVSQDLLKEIAEEIKEDRFYGYRIKRADFMFGKKLKFGETGNIKLVRLAKKTSGKWSGRVHEVWDTKGAAGELKNELEHHPHSTVAEFLSEIDFYSTIRAEELFGKNTKVTFFDILFYTKGKFIQNYFLKLGFKDGIPGFIVAIMMSLHSFLARSKLWLLTENQKKS